MPLLAAEAPLLGREADAFVDHGEPDAVPRGRERHAHVARVRVTLDVPERLGRDPVDEALVILREAQIVLQLEVDLDGARAKRRNCVGESRVEPAGAEAGRVEFDEQRAEASHGLSGPRSGGRQRGARRRRGLAVRRRAERVRDPGEVLDDAVVQVGGDAPPLVRRRLHRADEEGLALRLRPAQPPIESRREGDLHEPEQGEARDEQRRQGEPDAPPGRRHRTLALVGLEEQRRAVRGAHREVHLVERALASFVAVLRPGEVAELRPGRSGAQDVELLGAEWESRPDQARLVGIHHPSVALPELHPHDSLAEHTFLDNPVDGVDRAAVAAQKRGGERRLDNTLPGERRELARVPQRLRARKLAEGEHGGGGEHRQHDDAGQRELGDGTSQPRSSRRTTKVSLWPGPAQRHASRRDHHRKERDHETHHRLADPRRARCGAAAGPHRRGQGRA